MHKKTLCLALSLAAAATFAHADDWTPKQFFVSAGGVTLHSTLSATAGVVWPWRWSYGWFGGEWTGYTEGFVSVMNAKELGGGHEAFTQIGAVPMFRNRFDGGRSPMFFELGVGATYFDSIYHTYRKTFSTRFQFYDTVGVGMSFGPQRESEIGLRVLHESNAGIRHPNPGENFLLLRYARNF